MSAAMGEIPAEVQMALGRLFAMMSRKEQDGDIAVYHAIRSIVLEHAEPAEADYSPNFVRDRLLGATGDA